MHIKTTSKLIALTGLMAVAFGANAKQNTTAINALDKPIYTLKSHCVAEQDCLFEQFYISAGIGWVKGDWSDGDVTSQTSNLGFDVFDIDVDDDRVGGKINLGTSLTEKWSLELGYTNLGEVNAAFSTTTAVPTDFFELTQVVHPTSVKGFTLAAVYSFWEHDDWYLHGKIGAFKWRGDYDSLDVFETQDIEREADINDTDLYAGIGANYKWDENIQLILEWDHYRVDGAKINFISIGVAYHFD